MKRWTVMLIPDGRGKTRNLKLASYQMWVISAVVIALSFSTGFLYKRHQALARETKRLREANQELALQDTPGPDVAADSDILSARERTEIERKVRQEYKASVAAITSELNELYEIEAVAREMTGFAPRTSTVADEPAAVGDGKGGGPGGLPGLSSIESGSMPRPPHLIYGLSRPSADLIIQEIHIRKASLNRLVTDLRAEQDRIERMPSVWPTRSSSRRITSRFGYRKDPFTHRVRHHDGTDIVAPYGSPVVATAKGVVVSAGWDNYLGRMVKIDHGNGVETIYAHLKECLVEVGEEVMRFDKIGTLGNTGRSTGAHIHYEVQIDGKPVDSSKFLRN